MQVRCRAVLGAHRPELLPAVSRAVGRYRLAFSLRGDEPVRCCLDLFLSLRAEYSVYCLVQGDSRREEHQYSESYQLAHDLFLQKSCESGDEVEDDIATLTRLGLFCETMRLFLRAVGQEHPELRRVVPEGLAGRYLKEEEQATHYEDAPSAEGRRRLAVCARDLYRLVDRFGGTAAGRLEEYRLLQRLLREQCHVGRHGDGRPGDDDDDAGEGKVPIALKEPKEVPADSLQSPHDPDATYSGHKGKGYEVQVAESCHEENATQIITHVR